MGTGPAVCLIQPTRFPEASRVDIYEYARALAQAGVDTHVVVSMNMAAALPPGLTVHESGFPPVNTPGAWLRFAGRAAAVVHRLARERGQVLVHLFNPSPATWLLGRRLRSELPELPLIYDVRTGGLGHRPDAMLVNAMARSAPRFADRVIVLSDTLRNRLYAGAHRDRTRVVPLGVNLEDFRPAAARGSRSEYVYIYAGTLSANRRLAGMLAAFAIVRAAHPQARLRVIGDGDGESALRAQVRRADMESCVEFLGRRPYSEIPSLLADADCGLAYVPETPWFQPQPQLKTLEYLACGLPVVAVRTDGNRAVWDGLPPELLTGDGAPAFAEGMRFALERRPDLDFRAVALRHGWHAITRDRLLPVYRELIPI